MASIYEKASLILTHGVGYKAGSFYAQYPYGDAAKFSFVRDQISYRTTSCGIEAIENNEPGINFEDGIPHLSIQDTATNIVGNSDLSDWTLNITTRSLDAGISPQGKINATKLVVSAAYGENTIYKNITTDSGTFTYSVYAKALNKRYIILQIWTGSNSTDICHMFDLETGTAVANTTAYPNNGTPRITAVGNDWYRLSVTGTIASSSSIQPYVYICSSTSSLANDSGDIGKGFYLFGAQIEKHTSDGSLPSSYIPTSGGSASRTREYGAIGSFTPTSRRVTVYGHIRLRAETPTEEGAFSIFGFVNTTATTQYGLYYWGNDSNKFGFNTWNGDSYGISNSTISDGEWHKVVGVFDFDDFTRGELYIDGVKQSISQVKGTSLQRTAAPFSLASPTPSNQDPKCDYREVIVFDQELTEAECITLTS